MRSYQERATFSRRIGVRSCQERATFSRRIGVRSYQERATFRGALAAMKSLTRRREGGMKEDWGLRLRKTWALGFSNETEGLKLDFERNGGKLSA